MSSACYYTRFLQNCIAFLYLCYTNIMKKSRKILLKISIAMGILLFSFAVFSFVLLEPGIKIGVWETLDTAKLVKSENTLCFLDNDGKEIENTVSDANRVTVPFSSIPTHTVDAFVSIEDKRFYKHRGVDYIRIMGAFLNNVKSKSFKEGASTISQQLIKNTHLSSDKKISRKVKEIRIAKELERRFSKTEIMEMYLNMLYFGDNIYGINSAAKVFFDKMPSQLTLSESALLAGVINNPAKYSPYHNPENAKKRRNLVLTRMFENKKITQSQLDAAFTEEIQINRKPLYSNQYLNSVMKDVCKILGISKSRLLSKKFTVSTYYENSLEEKLKNIIDETDIPADANGHIIVIKNNDGSLLADASLTDVNIADLRRQPGSTIKPLICYAPALECGNIYCCSPIDDSPTSFGEYSPSNYKDRYNGWVSAKYALAHSLNIPAVKLLQSCGVDYGKSVCEKFGFDFTEYDNNLALSLGGMTEGVTLRQIADAYGAFACEGQYVKGSSIKSITDENGNIIYCDKRRKSDAVSADTAFLMNTMLRECAETGTAKKLKSLPNVCAKTGTVGDFDGNTDAYCIAYSPTYTVAAWVGSATKKMPNSISGGNVTCDMAKKVFMFLNDKENFSKPSTVLCRYIDKAVLEYEHDVLLAGKDIDIKDKSCEWFSEKYMPQEFSTPQYDDYFDYDELLNFDFDNFEIIDGLFD